MGKVKVWEEKEKIPYLADVVLNCWEQVRT